jgi:hypothetical protein
MDVDELLGAIREASEVILAAHPEVTLADGLRICLRCSRLWPCPEAHAVHSLLDAAGLS